MKHLWLSFSLFYIIYNIVDTSDDLFMKPDKAFLRKRNDGIENLTAKEIRRRLRLLVPYVDKNKDGSLSRQEVRDWVQEKYEDPHDNEDLQAEFRETDSNFDNKVDWNEYMWRKYNIRNNASDPVSLSRKENYKELIARDKRRWNFIDHNANKKLNNEEFLMFKRPKKYKEMLRIVAEEEILHSDIDQDGFLSLEEYLASLHFPDMKEYDTKLFKEKFDQNKDGKLDVEEVVLWKTPELFDHADLETKHLFDIADENEDNLLAPNEIDQHYFLFVGSKITQSGQMLHDEF